MGAKKKSEVHHPPPAPPAEKAAITTVTVKVTGGDFKVTDDLLGKYSNKMRGLIQHAKHDTISIQQADKEGFAIVVEYLNLHKEKEPAKISTPIKTNQQLKHIMEEEDAFLVERIIEKGDDLLLKILDLANFLEIDSLSRRLACGIGVKLTQSTLEDLEEEYELEHEEMSHEQMKSELQSMLDHLKHIPDQD